MDNGMTESKADWDYISQTEAKKEYVVVAVVADVAQVEDRPVSGETDVVGLGGNLGIGVHLVRDKLGLQCLRCDDDFLWMAIVGIGETGASLYEVEELSKDIDSLDGDQDYGWHRHDAEVRVGNMKVLHLPADMHGYSWEVPRLVWDS